MPIFNAALPKGTKVRLLTLEEALAQGILVDPLTRFSTHSFQHYFYYDEEYKNIVTKLHINGFLGQVVTVDSRDIKPPHLLSDPNTHYYRFKNEAGETSLMFVCLVKEVLS